MPITYENQEYAANETIKGFDSPDALAKGYLDLHTRVSSGSIELLPEELRKDPAVAPFKTLTDLTKGYVETKKMVGGIKKAPEKADDYKFTPMSNLHPNVKQDAIHGRLRGIFHKAGLHNEAADLVQQEIATMLSTEATNLETARKTKAGENESILRKEWGDKYDQNVDRIVKLLTTAGGPEAIAESAGVSQALKGAPALLRALGKITSLLSEDSIGTLGGGQTPEITDKSQAQKRINEIIQLKPNPILDEKHPDHVKIKKEWDDLHAVLSK